VSALSSAGRGAGRRQVPAALQMPEGKMKPTAEARRSKGRTTTLIHGAIVPCKALNLYFFSPASTIHTHH
jgi:hypothetical protein